LRDLAAAWESSAEPDAEQRHGDPGLIGALRQHKGEYRYILRSELVFRLKEQLDANPYFPFTGNYKVVVVDEYQDLNRCDVEVIDRIASRGAMLFVAGDDDQSIYQQLRHAHPQAIRDFVLEHSAADLRLTTCVRSDSQVIALAGNVISQEVGRAPKTLIPHGSAGPGIVEGIAFRTGDDEAHGIAQLVKKFVDLGVREQEILILLRSDFHGAFSTPIKTALDQLRIPSVVRTPERSALDSAAGRELLALLRLSLDGADDLAWRTSFETGGLGVGKTALAALHQLATSTPGMSFAGAVAVAEANPVTLGRSGTAIARAVATVRHRLASMAAAAPQESAAVAEIIEAAAKELPASPELSTAAGELLGLTILWTPTSLTDFMGGLALRQEEEESLVKGSVNIMTAHKAKGLDTCVVIIAAAEEELFPGRGQRDEERRLFYVSLTRAKHALFVTHAVQRYGQQARAGTGHPIHHLTKYLDGAGLVFRPGLTFINAFNPDVALLSPRPPMVSDVTE
jgi:DNA helicase-2/ATP-dependent DNA helicase PcrA